MTRQVSSLDNVIDSRDVIENIKELQGSIEAEILKTFEELPEDVDLDNADKVEQDLEGVCNQEQGDLVALLRLRDQVENYTSEWRYGVTLVRGSYFHSYAEEYAKDVGLISSDAAWPGKHIDWDAAADELRQDYAEVDFDGEPYYVRKT